jgi:DNA-binding LytR/AlgR family response regulator
MKVIIIEDEPLNARYLEDLLLKSGEAITVVEKLPSVKSAIQYLNGKPAIDLIFADIHLGDGLCFDIFSEVKTEIPIIFTTAYDHYAIQAFKLNSLDYLLKPIDKEELIHALQKFKKYNTSQFSISKELLFTLHELQPIQYKERFIVKKADLLLPIATKEITCFKSEQNVVFLVTHQGKEHPVDFTLEQLESVLNPNLFFRINRKVLLSMESATNISTHFNSRLKINHSALNEEQAIVSRERVSDFKKWLEG